MSEDAAAIAAAEPAETRPFSVYFGGPDQPPRALRDLLKARIEASPPGSEITWATYYFRDLDLAEALVAAHRRGVRVRVVLDAKPRREDANTAVISTLSQGLGDGLRLHRGWAPGAHLHAKIYAFSGPAPETFIGSFNPSGDTPENPDVVAEIGDQDRGHNLLVGFTNPADARALAERAKRVWSGRGLSRFNGGQNRALHLSSARLYFYPRLRTDIVEDDLEGLGPHDRVRAAVSHLKHSPLTRRLIQAAQAGADVQVVVHDTLRRVPQNVVVDLAAAGVRIQRYCEPRGLPMHAKFIVIEREGRRTAWFGSLNYNLSSELLNHEVAARSSEPRLIAALQSRFRLIAREAHQHAVACTTPEPELEAPSMRMAGDARPPWPE
jgi:phosphatidylserine/phosphatidylglycerophosphate/cardiolipin synthase-like enzyme